MKVVYMSVSDLIPYAFNNRKHSETQVDRVANSIQQFGFNQPIVVDENNVILVGHCRRDAAEKLGIDKVPVLKVCNLTETQKRAYRVLDNKLQNDSEWNFENLDLELKSLEDDDFPLEEWGLDSFKDLFPVEEPEAKEDDFEEAASLESEPFIKRGDLIELGRHRVLCGDSTSAEDWDALTAHEEIDFTFTSPPYNAGSNKLGGNSKMVDSKYISGGDARSESEYLDLLISSTGEAARCSRYVAVNLQVLANNKTAIIEWLHNFSDRFCDVAVWRKTSAQPAAAARVMNSAFEFIFFFAGDGEEPSRAIHTATFHGTVPNVYDGNGNAGSKFSAIHAAGFPVEFAAWVIKNFTQPKMKIADPFCGTGTTMIAAEQLNRTCYGMEIEPKYCQVIIDRYFKHCKDEGKEFSCKINGEPYFG